MQSDAIRIGHLASRIGVQPEAIRYYERLGLVPPPRREANNYRVYSSEHLERVDFIKKAQSLGLSLEEIRQLMELKFTEASPCQHVRDRLRDRLIQVEKQISRLRGLRGELKRALKSCETEMRIHSGDNCPVLKKLSSNGPNRRTK